MSVNKGKRSGGGRAKFFGFPLSKTGAQIIYILGILLLIGTLCSFIWLVYSFIINSVSTTLEIRIIYYIGRLILAIYMIIVGRKGR